MDPAMYDGSESSGYQLVLDKSYGADRSKDPNAVSIIIIVKIHRSGKKFTP